MVELRGGTPYHLAGVAYAPYVVAATFAAMAMFLVLMIAIDPKSWRRMIALLVPWLIATMTMFALTYTDDAMSVTIGFVSLVAGGAVGSVLLAFPTRDRAAPLGFRSER